MATQAQLDAYFTDVMQQLGVPVTRPNLIFFKAWTQVEGTSAKNNPLATTYTSASTPSAPLPGNSAGVQQYTTAHVGATATAATLQNYPNIVNALQTGNILQVSFKNPPGLVADFSKWSGNANNPAAGMSYYVNIVRAAQGNPSGGGATDIGSYDITNLYKDSGAKGVVDAALAVPKFLGKITDPIFLLRALEVVGGALLAILGLYLLAKQIGLSDVSVPAQLSPAARQADAAAATVQAQKAQRQTEAHEARISESQARVKTQQARATELRTRVKHRRRLKGEQEAAEKRAYIRGVAERAPLA